jgi:origin recognition complex subunit 5
MSRVFLRELSSTQFETASSVQSASSSSTPAAAAPVGVASSAGGVVNSLELPYYSKYLLLAAYIASYNPAKTDKRFFSKVTFLCSTSIPDPFPFLACMQELS